MHEDEIPQSELDRRAMEALAMNQGYAVQNWKTNATAANITFGGQPMPLQPQTSREWLDEQIGDIRRLARV